MAGVVLAVSVSLAQAQDLAQKPLHLETASQPNIMLLLDNSGSMNYELLMNSEAAAAHPDVIASNSMVFEFRIYQKPDQMRMHCSGFNQLAYDPAQTYVPWQGEDSGGSAFADQSIAAARQTPYDKSSRLMDLRNAYYIRWVDADNDGRYDAGECNDSHQGEYVDSACAAGRVANCVPVSSMSAAEQTNFANWYSYYRKREYVMKGAVSRLISRTRSRMGMAPTESHDQGLEVRDLDDISEPVDSAARTAKQALLQKVFALRPSKGTSLRQRLYDTGGYFHRADARSGTSLLGYVPSHVSPILAADEGGACQKNFALLMTDGYWNAIFNTLGNEDGDASSAYDGGSYGDRFSNTLADVAMYLYETDLAPDLPDQVSVSAADPNPRQHLNTFTIAYGVQGRLNADPADPAAAFNWYERDPGSFNRLDEAPEKIDDLRHAAWNGRGAFLSAYSAAELNAAFDSAMSKISSRSAGTAAPAANAYTLTASTRIYQAVFETLSWAGHLYAYDFDGSGNAKRQLWDAADRLPGHAARNIFSHNGSAGFEFTTAAWDGGDFSAAQQSALNRVDGSADGNGRQRVAYLRGERTDEGGLFRSRRSLLGDMVNSPPVYVGTQDYGLTGLSSYATDSAGITVDAYESYLNDAAISTGKGARPPALYVGGNDGMLHAFAASGSSSADCRPGSGTCEGEELFAYVPKGVYGKLSSLTSPRYEHQYFVDGPAREGDAYIELRDPETGSRKTRWGSVLVGTLGAGGKGVFALDVSRPDRFSAADVLWDLDDGDLEHLGYTLGQATIARLPNGRWAAVFGNGYYSKAHKAVLYIVDLQDPTRVVALDTGAAGSDAKTNGLSSPYVVDSDGDKIADAAYAGDLYGNLWKFDLSDSNSGQWAVAYGSKRSPAPLFRACADQACSSPQPITARPVATRNSYGGIQVLFGTGKYFQVSDAFSLDSPQVQSFYGLQDSGSPINGRSALQAQTIVAQQSGGNFTARLSSNNRVNYGAQKGWYLDFDTVAGERVLAAPDIRSGYVRFTTALPSLDLCSFGGSAFAMALDVLSGGRPAVSYFDINEDGTFDSSDYVSYRDEAGNTQQLFATGVSLRGLSGNPAVVKSGSNYRECFNTNDGSMQCISTSGGNGVKRRSWIQIR